MKTSERSRAHARWQAHLRIPSHAEAYPLPANTMSMAVTFEKSKPMSPSGISLRAHCANGETWMYCPESSAAEGQRAVGA